jgi:hypothetical protein
MDKEHVLPNWLANELSDVGMGTHERIGAFGEDKGKWKARPFTVRVGTVCPDCNQGWMHVLENEVRPWLTPMLHGRGRTYYEGGLTGLATWAAKTALVIGSRAESIPRAPFEALFRDRRRPPDTMTIWMGSYHWGVHQNVRTFVPVHIDGAGDEPGVTNAYSVTFTVSYALFHVFGDESGKERYDLADPLARSLRRIWPLPDEPVTWPPPGPPLMEDDINAIANAHGEVLPPREAALGRPNRTGKPPRGG